MAQTETDPVCGMQVDPARAAASETHEGRTFYFCSEGCHQAFLKDPHRYGHPTDASAGHGEHGGHGGHH